MQSHPTTGKNITPKSKAPWWQKNIFIVSLFIFSCLFIYSYEYFRGGYKIPSAMLNLSGEIEPGFHYKLTARYSATKDNIWCRGGNYNSPHQKEYIYYPDVENGKHETSISLNEFSTTSGCLYRLSSIGMHFLSQKVQQRGASYLLLSDQFHSTAQVNYAPRLTNGSLQERDLFCFPFPKPVAHFHIPNEAWVCRKKIKDGEIKWKRPGVTLAWSYNSRSPAFVYDSNANGNFDLVLNIKTISHKNSIEQCFQGNVRYGQSCPYSR